MTLNHPSRIPSRARGAGNAKSATVAPVDLALQGGGSHGAFTWGVLDRLLEDESLNIGAISGTSAGAMNAAVLATGYAQGGREGARLALRNFWRDISHAGAIFSPLPGSTTSTGNNPFSLENSLGHQWVGPVNTKWEPA